VVGRHHAHDVRAHASETSRPIAVHPNLTPVGCAPGAGTAEDQRRGAEEAGGFGLFIRSLVGVDRAAAKEAFGTFLASHPFNANQIHFIETVIDHLAADGVVAAERFYEPPFTDVAPRGPEGLFTDQEITEMIEVLNQVRKNAGAA
jgi:type I restriction enzyme, R subunit